MTAILLSGGGTAGHVFPALALREALLRRHPDWRFAFVGTRGGLETELVPRADLPLEFIEIEGLVGRGWRSLRALLKLPGALRAAGKLLDHYKPALVAGFGGYASFPLLWAAAGRSLPTLIHESNLAPGFANRRLAARVAARATAYESAKSPWPDAVVTGMPVRAGFAEAGAARISSPGKLRVLVAGGSRGAAGLNRMVATDLKSLAAIPGLSLRHQAGAAHAAALAGEFQSAGLPAPEPFIHDMAAAMREADLFVGRAGASTLAEVSAAGLPALLVPFPAAAGDHQRLNALGLANLGAAEVLEEQAFVPGALAARLRALAADPARLAAMAAASRAAGRPDAAERLADLAEKLLGGRA